MAYAFAVVALAAFLRQFIAWFALEFDAVYFWEPIVYVSFILFFALTMAGVLIAFVVIVNAVGGLPENRRGRVSLAAAGICVGLAFLAAAPLSGGWDDGCNGHGAVFPAISLPYLAFYTPETPWVVYEHSQSLVGCTGEKSGGSFSLWSLGD